MAEITLEKKENWLNKLIKEDRLAEQKLLLYLLRKLATIWPDFP